MDLLCQGLSCDWASLVAQTVEESTCNVGDLDWIPRLGRFPWKRARQVTPVFLSGESYE